MQLFITIEVPGRHKFHLNFPDGSSSNVTGIIQRSEERERTTYWHVIPNDSAGPQGSFKTLKEAETYIDKWASNLNNVEFEGDDFEVELLSGDYLNGRIELELDQNSEESWHVYIEDEAIGEFETRLGAEHAVRIYTTD